MGVLMKTSIHPCLHFGYHYIGVREMIFQVVSSRYCLAVSALFSVDIFVDKANPREYLTD
jgi:hypothetical protein